MIKLFNKLPNSEFLFLHYSYLFLSDEQKNSRNIKFKQINIDKNDFISSCENPFASSHFSLYSLFLGFLNPFQYKLYTEIFIAFIFLFSSILIFPTFFNYSFLPITFSLFSISFFFLFFSQTLWHRKIYFYLDYCYKHNIIPNLNIFSLKFKPYHFIFTFFLGSLYIFTLFFFFIYSISFFI